jgi:hypothetical protein
MHGQVVDAPWADVRELLVCPMPRRRFNAARRRGRYPPPTAAAWAGRVRLGTMDDD